MTTMSVEPVPSETAVILVRHGESVANVERRFGGHGPTPLTDLGHAQARAAGAAIAAELAPTAIVTSDLPRATQTAAHIARATGLPVDATADLRERGLGRLDGLPFEEVERRHPDDWAGLIAHDPDWCAPGGGESTRAAFARIVRAVDDVVDRYRGGRVVVVSHGVAIYLVFAHLCGVDPLGARTRVYIHHDNGSITRATLRRGDTWRIDAVNDTHHLTALSAPR